MTVMWRFMKPRYGPHYDRPPQELGCIWAYMHALAAVARRLPRSPTQIRWERELAEAVAREAGEEDDGA